ncbi:MAG: hypothetical protein KDK37_04425 [Leptospiraceae bacterium]|nr:hypothetical protein [Leptospiraceae bacterium]MCB1303493.1 hypothetical protein [Leptospiraceae bacterium]
MQPPAENRINLTEHELEVIEIFQIAYRSVRRIWWTWIPVFLVELIASGWGYYQASSMLVALNPEAAGDFQKVMEAMNGGPGWYQWMQLLLFCLTFAAMYFPTKHAAELTGFSDPENRQMFAYVIGCILLTVFSAVGLLLCILPGFVVLFFLCMYPSAIVVEKSNPFRAIGMAFRVATIRPGKIFALLFLFLLVTMLATLGSMIPYFAYSITRAAQGSTPDFIGTGALLLLYGGIGLVSTVVYTYGAHLFTVAYGNLRSFIPAGQEF